MTRNSKNQAPWQIAGIGVLALTVCYQAAGTEPVVVHYSDRNLARMEKTLGVTANQKERFEDIVVKYRDPSEEVESPYTSSLPTGSVRETKKVPRKELDELATILRPSQIKQFQQLHDAAHKQKRKSGGDGSG